LWVRCPACGNEETKVVDSRAGDDGATIRRRRACVECSFRFTTFERMEVAPLVVVKRDGAREPFDRLKITRGLAAASKGRPIEADTFEALADEIEERARSGGSAVSSEWIGRAVLDRLRLIDQVASLRFASVYKDFTGIDDFEREVTLIKLNPG
jgi:transcriptional repressor NrdR